MKPISEVIQMSIQAAIKPTSTWPGGSARREYGSTPEVETANSGAIRQINEARLGMAMKETYKLWRTVGKHIWGPRKKEFIDEVIQAYQLFTEIAETVRRAPEDASGRM